MGNKELGTLEITVEATQYFLWGYIAVNALVAVLLLAMRRVPLLLVQWAVFAMSLVDGIFVSALVVVTGGYDSILYWLFLGLMVRGAVSVPRATSQILLNLTLTVCYVMAGASISRSTRPSSKRQSWAVWKARFSLRANPMRRPRSHVHAATGEPAIAARGRNGRADRGRVPRRLRRSLVQRTIWTTRRGRVWRSTPRPRIRPKP